MNFDDNGTSYINLVESDHPRVHTERIACWLRMQTVNGVCASTTER